MRKRLFLLLLALHLVTAAFAQTNNKLTLSGTTFLLNGQPFPYTGISFFNAMYNPTFNQTSAERTKWLEKFKRYGINVLRVWCQWDNKRGFVDAGPEATLYFNDGRLRPQPLERLKAIITDADKQGMVVLLVLFARESWDENTRLAPKAADKAVATLTRELQPYRNIVFQIWNEHSERVVDHYKTIKAIDPRRLVTNSPGWGGELGDQQQNNTLDFLSPHTSRQNVGRHWEVAPQEIVYLLTRFRKPVVDDEPARNGTPEFGGPRDGSSPYDHILQIQRVWQLGGYIVYHHDMFQKGYGHASVPPSGIPDPEFNPYHRQVLEFVAQKERYMQKWEGVRK